MSIPLFYNFPGATSIVLMPGNIKLPPTSGTYEVPAPTQTTTYSFVVTTAAGTSTIEGPTIAPVAAPLPLVLAPVVITIAPTSPPWTLAGCSTDGTEIGWVGSSAVLKTPVANGTYTATFTVATDHAGANLVANGTVFAVPNTKSFNTYGTVTGKVVVSNGLLTLTPSGVPSSGLTSAKGYYWNLKSVVLTPALMGAK